MAAVVERIPVLVTAGEKTKIAKKARQAGLSVGELLRRAAASYSPAGDDAMIEAMISQMLKTTQAANGALDDALAYVAKSNRRIAALEAKRNVKAA